MSAIELSEAVREVAKWLNEEPSKPVDRQAVALLVAHVQREMDAKAVPLPGAPFSVGDGAHWSREVRDREGRGVAWCGQLGGQKMARLIADRLNAHPPAAQDREPMTDEQIEKLREKTFSTNNPYCPVDSKSMRKAVWAAEAFHNIKEPQRC